MSKSKMLFFLLIISSCANHGQLTLEGKLPKKLKENSGIASFGGNSAWFVEDNGNSDNIYKTDLQGNIIRQLEVKNAKNRDWEDLTKDKKGNLYIGDFGNNGNTRKNLIIYKLPNPTTEKGEKITAKKIKFNYPEQENFPPKKEQLIFDAEAFFHHNNHLYIFTKNRATPFTGKTSIYRLPDKEGNHEAKLMGTITLGSDWDTCRVTSADISQDGKTIALLGYGKLWLLTDFSLGDFSKGNLQEIDLGIRTQLEAVCFVGINSLLLSDEGMNKTGRNLYSYQLK